MSLQGLRSCPHPCPAVLRHTRVFPKLIWLHENIQEVPEDRNIWGQGRDKVAFSCFLYYLHVFQHLHVYSKSDGEGCVKRSGTGMDIYCSSHTFPAGEKKDIWAKA